MKLSLYLDPRHEKSLRLVFFYKNTIHIHGVFDNDDPLKKSWSVNGTKLKDVEQYEVNFCSKEKHEGKQFLKCTLLNDNNILWADGNHWIFLPSNLSNISEKKDLVQKFLILKKIL